VTVAAAEHSTRAQAALERIAALRKHGGHRRAIQLATLELNREPPAPLAAALRIERARCLVLDRAWDRAELDCRRAAAESDAASVQALLGRCLLEQKRGAEAVPVLEAALRSDAGASADDWALYARALSAALRHDEACNAAERARQLAPGHSTTFLEVLASAGRHGDVIVEARRELERAPQQAWLWSLLGSSLDALGRSSEAVVALREAVALAPERVDAHCSLGMALLRLGDYEAGFRHYEYRQHRAGRRRLGVPAWQGEPLRGKHLVVRAEQGLGDSIQFARFLQRIRSEGGQTTFVVPPALVRLLRSNPGLGDVQGDHPAFGVGDYQTLVMSLPHHLGVGDQVGAVAVPYLFPDEDLVRRWRARLPARPRVALAWQGNPSYAGDRWRSMPFTHFERLLTRHERRLHFISVQKHAGKEQLQASPLAASVTDLGQYLDNAGDAFVETLAVLAETELLITTDNGLAHLAGAAGIRTWLLLGKAPDWRWGLSGAGTRWYPSLRLFRQASSGDWAGVVEAVSAELAAVSSQPG
jgi:tetratricopeptide (TPR) repeat protein